MVRYIFLMLLMVALNTTYAQNNTTVQWANQVLEFSTELSKEQFGAKQILHKPNVLPRIMESPNAWAPKNPKKKDFIKVGFEKPIKIKQIAIAESYNASAIEKIYIYDIFNKEYLLSEHNPGRIEKRGRILNIFIDQTEFEVAAVKIICNGKAVEGFYGIDAVGISESHEPIKALVNIAPFLKEEIPQQKLSDQINSPVSEINPILSPDGSTIFFSRQNYFGNTGGVNDYEDIWYSEKDENGNWQEAKNIGGPLNNNYPNFISSMAGNGDILYLGNEYRKNGKMKAGISMSKKTPQGWSKPTPIKIKNNYNSSDNANFFVTNDQKIMLLSVERDDSFGDRDIYVSFLKKDGSYTEPLNLGPDVNTAEEESAPFLSKDGKSLYFSSEGYSGYGGLDIYVSHRLDDTWVNWSEPQNLGPQINTPNHDEFFIISENEDFAYYCSGPDDNMDIIEVKLPIFDSPANNLIVQGRIFDSQNNKPLSAKITFTRLSDGKEIGIIETDAENGTYTINLPKGEIYYYSVEAEGFQNIKATFDLNNISESTELGSDLYLSPVVYRDPQLINSIFFKKGIFELSSEAFPELDSVIGFMKENPNANLVISGYTDDVGPREFNKHLSLKRAEQVLNFLITKGIERERMKALGFGAENPIAQNETEEGRQMNRRVEFILEN
jgi:OmpA-OmpF porin, OOP family